MLISGFTDEISTNLDDQIENAKKLGLRYIAVRRVNEKNVLDLSVHELHGARRQLRVHGIKVDSIGSPIGKTPVDTPVENVITQAEQAVTAALILRASQIRLFSFYTPEEVDPESNRSAVLERLQAVKSVADGLPITFVLENERGLYGDICCRYASLVQELGPSFGLAFDPGNAVMVGENALEACKACLPYIKALHVKDASKAEERFVPAGKGDASFEEIISRLGLSFKGPYVLEPHLGYRRELSPFEQFELARDSFLACLA